MRCLPGFFPVMNDVHAGGVIGGRMDARRPEAPSFISWARLGNLPSLIHGLIRSNVAPSRPTISTFILLIRHIWAPEKFCLDCWSISHLLLRERRVEVSKKLNKFPDMIDSVARGLRTRLPAPADAAVDDCWPPVPRVIYRILLQFAPRCCASQNVRIRGSSHSVPVPRPDSDLRGGQQCPLPIVLR